MRIQVDVMYRCIGIRVSERGGRYVYTFAFPNIDNVEIEAARSDLYELGGKYHITATYSGK